MKDNQKSKLNLFCTIHRQKAEGMLNVYFIHKFGKELSLDPCLVFNTYAKQILRTLTTKTAKPSTSSFVSDSPTTKESNRSKPSSSKTWSTTLKT